MSSLADSAARMIASNCALAAAANSRGDTLSVKIVAPATGVWSALGHIAGQSAATLLAVFTGVVVFVITQALAKLAIEPALEVRRVIGRIAHALIFYASTYANPGIGPPEHMDEVQRALRNLSSELSAAAVSVPPWARGLLARMGIVPAWPAVRSAAGDLIGLSNGMRGAMGSTGLRNAETASSIRASLGIGE